MHHVISICCQICSAKHLLWFFNIFFWLLKTDFRRWKKNHNIFNTNFDIGWPDWCTHQIHKLIILPNNKWFEKQTKNTNAPSIYILRQQKTFPKIASFVDLTPKKGRRRGHYVFKWILRGNFEPTPNATI